MDTSRFFYNRAVEYLKSNRASKYDLRKLLLSEAPEWSKACPFHVKAEAIFDAWKATGERKFRSSKEPVQSCAVPSSAVKPSGIYPTISGKGLKYSESLPDDHSDCRLVYRCGKFYLCVPYEETRKSGENQAFRVCSVDPGVRTFLTVYSEDCVASIGSGDFSRIQRLCAHLDDLVSRSTKAERKRQKSMRRAAARLRERIRNLIDELHHKAALFLASNFDLILIPSFETSQMTRRAGRKIRTKTARSMLTFAHYRFRMFLKHKAFELGKRVEVVSEAFTSKTHPETGKLFNVGSAKRIRLSSGEWINRDVSGARNILLRALAEPPCELRLASRVGQE